MRLSRPKTLAALFAMLAALIAAVQPFGYSPDYFQYSYFFDELRLDYLYQLRESRFESGFLYLSFLLTKVIENNAVVYGVLVFFAVFVKIRFAGKFSAKGYFGLFLIFFFFKFFPLHELTQIRAALAASFLIAVFYCVSASRYWLALFFSLIAVSFHNSAVLVLPFFFLPDFMLTRGRVILMALAFYAICFVASSSLVEFMASRLYVFETYVASGFESRRDSAFSPVFYPEFLMIFLSFVFWNDLTTIMRKVLAIEVLGFAMFYGLIDLGVVAVRGRELFSVIWIVYVAQFPFAKERAKMGMLAFVISSVVVSIYLFFVRDFFTSGF